MTEGVDVSSDRISRICSHGRVLRSPGEGAASRLYLWPRVSTLKLLKKYISVH